jgi:hypothetical protein
MSERSDIIIGELAKNSRETLRVAVGEFKGHELVHIRAWVSKGDDNEELIPTKSGVTLRRVLLPQLISLLQKVVSQ